MKTIKDYCVLSLKGFCMGCADVVPGVSGGTIAFMLGIYEEFIGAIKSFDMYFVRHLLRREFKEAISHVRWKFLGSVVLGIACAILLLSNLLEYLFEEHPTYVYSFFFGLILATVPIMGSIIKNWAMKHVIVAGVVSILTYYIVLLSPVNTPDALWFVFLSGALAISAMILPGISGAFILVLLGKYEFIVSAINERDFLVIGVFMLGMIVGILCFVRVLSVLFRRYHNATVIILTGIVFGSLGKIWPWKETLEYMMSRHGELIPAKQINVLPASFDGEFFISCFMIILGFILAFVTSDPKHRTTIKV